MDTWNQTLTKLTRLHDKSHPTHHRPASGDGGWLMELLTHNGEHHEIGDGGWLMVTMATDSPLLSPERTPDQPFREVLGLGGGFVS